MLPTVMHLNRPVSHVHLPSASSVAPAINEKEFKDSMASLAFSIAVVTARNGNEEIGRTVTSFMPLSAVPPRILISIDVRSRFIDLVGETKAFSISFLSAAHKEIGDAFAGKWAQTDRFALADWDIWPSGNRKLVDAVLSMDCELTASIDTGDHMLFVGTVVDSDGNGLLGHLIWKDRSYATLKGAAQEREPEGSAD